jgi:hypothetical protein
MFGSGFGIPSTLTTLTLGYYYSRRVVAVVPYNHTVLLVVFDCSNYIISSIIIFVCSVLARSVLFLTFFWRAYRVPRARAPYTTIVEFTLFFELNSDVMGSVFKHSNKTSRGCLLPSKALASSEKRTE